MKYFLITLSLSIVLTQSSFGQFGWFGSGNLKQEDIDTLAELNVVVTDATLVTAPTGTPDGTKFWRDDGTWQAIPGGGDALTSSPLNQFAATTSAQFASVISDETGTNLVVLSDSPTLVTPNLDTPSAITLTNATGLTSSGVLDNAITNAKLDDVPTATIKGRITAAAGDPEDLTPAQVQTIINVEDGATADQTDAEIETAYNNQVAKVSGAEITGGTEAAVRRYSPADVKAFVDQHAGGGGDLSQTDIDTLAELNAIVTDATLGDSGDFATAAQGALADSALQDVADDTAPQLSGPLDVNGQEIQSAGDVVFQLGDAAGVNKLSIQDSGSAEVASINSDGDLSVLNLDTDTFRINDSTDGSHYMEFVVPDLVANITGTVPSTSSFTFVDLSSTQTLTNKTISGASNTLQAIAVSSLANGTDGELITWDAAGAPATVAVGTSGHVLTSNGAGAAPTFQAAGGGDLNEADIDTLAELNAIVTDATLVDTASTQTVTNKTLDSGSNTIRIHDEEHTGAGPHALTASDCYNGVHYVTAASTVTLPAVADGMSLTIISEIAGTVVVDPNSADTIKLDGTSAAQDENIESPGAVGDIVTLTYRAANTWYAASNSWTEATP